MGQTRLYGLGAFTDLRLERAHVLRLAQVRFDFRDVGHLRDTHFEDARAFPNSQFEREKEREREIRDAFRPARRGALAAWREARRSRAVGRMPSRGARPPCRGGPPGPWPAWRARSVKETRFFRHERYFSHKDAFFTRVGNTRELGLSLSLSLSLSSLVARGGGWVFETQTPGNVACSRCGSGSRSCGGLCRMLANRSRGRLRRVQGRGEAVSLSLSLSLSRHAYAWRARTLDSVPRSRERA